MILLVGCSCVASCCCVCRGESMTGLTGCWEGGRESTWVLKILARGEFSIMGWVDGLCCCCCMADSELVEVSSRLLLWPPEVLLPSPPPPPPPPLLLVSLLLVAITQPHKLPSMGQEGTELLQNVGIYL